MIRSDFESICRLCIQRSKAEKLIDIFTYQLQSNEISLPEKVKFCFAIEIKENDGYPFHICWDCLAKLKQSFIFRNQCVLADLTLKHLVQSKETSLDDILNLKNADLENEVFTSSTNFVDIYNKYGKALNFQKGNKSDKKPNDKVILPNYCFENQNILFEEKNKAEINFEEYKNCDDQKNVLHSKDYCAKTKVEKKFVKFEKISKSASKTKKLKNKENKSECCNFGDETSNSIVDPIECEIKEVKPLKRKNKIFDINISKNVIKTVTKIKKLKTLEVNKGRNGKLEKVKEKPSSYTCDYCQKVYPSEGGWRYHIHTMHNANYQPFICDLCGQSFKVKKNLEGHKNSIHFRLKLNLCDVCGRGFASKYALKVHKIWHNDEKDFACDICGTRFRTRGKLNTHKSIHGGPKNFMCHICSRIFRWKKDFEVHMRTHTGEKPFKCSHCGKAFASLTNMRKHERNDRSKIMGNAEQDSSGNLRNSDGT